MLCEFVLLGLRGCDVSLLSLDQEARDLREHGILFVRYVERVMQVGKILRVLWLDSEVIGRRQQAKAVTAHKVAVRFFVVLPPYSSM